MKWLVLFLGCLLFHLAGTWSLPLIDRDEPRFAEAAREMRERGDYVVPHFNNQYRFDKPPLTYWFQTLSYSLFGENDFAARFPSAVAAALTAVLLYAWGQRLQDEPLSGRDASPKRPTNSDFFLRGKESNGPERRPYLNKWCGGIGWRAALIFTLCLQTFMHGKAAVADMWLVFFVTAAHWAGYELLFGKEHRTQNFGTKWWWIFYLSLAFAFLAKGPIGWTPLLAIAATKFFLHIPKLRFAFLPGLVVTLTIVALWGVPALLRTDGEFFNIGIGRHVVARSIVTMEGHGGSSLATYLLTLPFFFITVFLSFFPWSIKLPWLTKRLWRARDATDNYLVAGAAVIFLVFTLVKTKLPHYTLPAFPLLALLLARHWPALTCVSQTFRRIAIATACVCLAVALFLFPMSGKWFPSLQLFKASRDDLRPQMEFGAVGYNEPSLVWYFRGRVNGFLDSALDAKRVGRFMEEPGPRFVILPTTLAAKTYPRLPDGWKTFRTQGINISKGKWVDLTLILKPE